MKPNKTLTPDMKPVNSEAAKILSNRFAIKQEDEAVEDRIAELIEIKLTTSIRLAEIEGILRESTRQYHEYGVSGDPGEYKALKVEQAKQNHLHWLAGHEIERYKKARTSSRARDVSQHFMSVAKAELAPDTFWSMLRRAEALAAAKA